MRMRSRRWFMLSLCWPPRDRLSENAAILECDLAVGPACVGQPNNATNPQHAQEPGRRKLCRCCSRKRNLSS
jgi:hypothetical protein